MAGVRHCLSGLVGSPTCFPLWRAPQLIRSVPCLRSQVRYAVVVMCSGRKSASALFGGRSFANGEDSLAVRCSRRCEDRRDGYQRFAAANPNPIFVPRGSLPRKNFRSRTQVFWPEAEPTVMTPVGLTPTVTPLASIRCFPLFQRTAAAGDDSSAGVWISRSTAKWTTPCLNAVVSAGL